MIGGSYALNPHFFFSPWGWRWTSRLQQCHQCLRLVTWPSSSPTDAGSQRVLLQQRSEGTWQGRGPGCAAKETCLDG